MNTFLGSASYYRKYVESSLYIPTREQRQCIRKTKQKVLINLDEPKIEATEKIKGILQAQVELCIPARIQQNL